MIYIDVKVNNIVIASCNETRDAAFIEVTEVYYPIFTYYNCFNRTNNNTFGPNNMKLESRDNIVKKILAGDGIDVYDDKTKTILKDCSVGFWARDQANINYIATAGHCLRTGTSYYHLPWDPPENYSLSFIGSMTKYRLEPIDFGIIKLDAAEDDIKPEPSIRNTDSERYKQLLIEDDIAVTSNGVHLCRSGVITHVMCGYVKSLNGFTTNGIVYHENIFVVSAGSKGGDSGGPIFSFKQDLIHVSLNGILTSGLGNFDDDINGIIGVITMSSIYFIFNDISIVTVTPN
ncbi:serine protease [Gigaspora margarita]|uniref:Serine protease n=1 Tax=Gigaspora margarita TaxID=4874 RepID=A0A8H4ATN9_GIGMA|nr:serine protease [Gigaspora margarita]